jgi:thiosulfate/3-mercaptopyruvate sulfurtransferase
MPSTLIEPQELAARLDDPEWAIIDCRFDLARPEWGAQAYAAGHIPHALYAHLDRDLSAPRTARSGRHPLPALEVLAATFTRFGIDEGVQVIAYDQGPGAFAARLWWLLRWLGHAQVAVLNGGFAAWERAGLPLTRHSEPRAPRRFSARPEPGALASGGEVAELVHSGALRRGQRLLVDAHGRFLQPTQLRQSWQPTLRGAPARELIAMCGSGVTACHNLLALEAAGLCGARLYAGSWSEWINDPTHPVARGPQSER